MYVEGDGGESMPLFGCRWVMLGFLSFPLLNFLVSRSAG